MDNTIDKLISQLEFLARIRKGDKICIKSHTIVSKKSWYGSFIRYWHDENRSLTLTTLEDIYSQCCQNLSLPHFYPLVSNATIGISNLADTYNDDPDTSQRLLSLLSRFQFLVPTVPVHINSVTGPNDMAVKSSFTRTIFIPRRNMTIQHHVFIGTDIIKKW